MRDYGIFAHGADLIAWRNTGQCCSNTEALSDWIEAQFDDDELQQTVRETAASIVLGG